MANIQGTGSEKDLPLIGVDGIEEEVPIRDNEQIDLLEKIFIQLKILNLHMEVITDNEFIVEDVEDQDI